VPLRRRSALGEPIDLDSALRAITLGGAVAMGQEDDHGSLEVGKYADMIVLDRDVTATPLEELHRTVVRRTIFNGEVVYEASVDR
jgi:predicted amidohydrolase YtcJ